ncbi:glycosyltransferase [Methylobacterium organophilum]|nr:glycosyltransferase [Methylobacterium organophilum]
MGFNEETFKQYDVVVITHALNAVLRIFPWARPGQKIIYRSIGQSSEAMERFIGSHRSQLTIARYSLFERFIPGFVGSDAEIRFAKRRSEFDAWQGGSGKIITFSSNARKRGPAVRADFLEEATSGLPWVLYGIGNDDHPNSGGVLSDDDQHRALRTADAYLAAHTTPASYTLGIIEAMMTGVPIVAMNVDAISEEAHSWARSVYEVPHIIEHEKSGFLASTASEARTYLMRLISDRELAKNIGDAGRARAIELFDESVIAEQWRNLLAN